MERGTDMIRRTGFGAIAVVATAGWGSAIGATVDGTAVSVGDRSVVAADLQRVEKAVAGAPATTIYLGLLPDGTIGLSDRPLPDNATDHRVTVGPQDAASRKRGDADRAYWRKQGEAFEQRRQQRETATAAPSAAGAAPSAGHPHPATWGSYGPHEVYHGYGWLPGEELGGWPWRTVAVRYTDPWRPVPLPGVSPMYLSTPGAALGRGSGFLGSGFTSRR